MWRTSWSNMWFANKPNMTITTRPACSNLYPFQRVAGKLSPWTLLKAYLHMKDTTQFSVVGRYTKYAHFIPLKHPFTAPGVARAMFDNVIKLHGLPRTIISNWDRIFFSAFWKELFTIYGTSLLHSTAYHPQTDGQSERVNQCLEMYLRCTIMRLLSIGSSGSHQLRFGTTLVSIHILVVPLQSVFWIWTQRRWSLKLEPGS